ncbi:MAG: hypothetical protein Q4P23_07035, partial [Micrococcaceae bacterium]|nr:hypothetical protein [Micrococcaceae bacterium]
MQDESLPPMRRYEGIIDRADRIGRTTCGKDAFELKITHSPKDVMPLPITKSRDTAKGCTELSHGQSYRTQKVRV